jgi:membrane-associated phospholipid phosphatase
VIGEGEHGDVALDVPLPLAEDAWQGVRRAAYCVYFAVVAALLIRDGMPTDRGPLAVLIIIGLALTSVGRGWRVTAQVFVDWLPFTLVLLLYDRTRNVADGLGIHLHEADVLGAEKWLFGGTEPSVWLQGHLYDAVQVHWYDALVTLIYTSHFVATPILAAFLWLHDRALWLRYISRVIALAVAGLATYCVFPEAPPWLAARDGLSEPIARLSSRGWVWLHADNLDHVIANAQNDGANPIAAMPSLHLAFAVLVALMLGTTLRSRWRFLLALYPLAMAFTLVYTGEHYVLDLIAGAAYAFAVHRALNRWDRWRAGRLENLPVAAPADSRSEAQLSAR